MTFIGWLVYLFLAALLVPVIALLPFSMAFKACSITAILLPAAIIPIVAESYFLQKSGELGSFVRNYFVRALVPTIICSLVAAGICFYFQLGIVQSVFSGLILGIATTLHGTMTGAFLARLNQLPLPATVDAFLRKVVASYLRRKGERNSKHRS